MKQYIRIIIVGFFVLSFPVLAQAQLLMEESRVELDVAPGSTISRSMAIYNTSDKEVKVKVYWQDFVYHPPFNGKKDFLPAGTSEYSLADWISFNPKEFVMGPKTKKKIDYVINIPQDAKGGHYGVLFFEQEPEKTNATNVVTIVTRLGSLFFIRSTDRTKEAKVETIQATDQQLTGIIENFGNIFIFPKGVFYVLDDQGMVADRGEVKKIYLPPGQKADFKLPFSENLSSGKYTNILTFDLDDGDSVVKEVDFIKDPNGQTNIVGTRD